jgi:hypothetical protein
MSEPEATPGASPGHHISRAALVKGAIGLGGGLFAGAALSGNLVDLAESKPSAKQDAEILNFVLVLEELQTAFYAEAVQRSKLEGPLLDFAKIVGDQERQHTAFVRKALGSNARKAPKFDFGDATGDPKAFAKAAVTLEDIGVAAYNAQAANLTAATLAAAAKIASVEARHASWISDLVGRNPAPFASEPTTSAAAVTSRLHKTGFVVQ